jgi:SAM-dependent methyltransferase
MGQVTTGIRRILSLPAVYDTLQCLLGGDKARHWLVNDVIRPETGQAILDLGCGTGAILDHLPDDVTYAGFDISERYIARARARRPGFGTFHSRAFRREDLGMLPKFDTAIAAALLHHLSDEEVESLFELVAAALKPGGRLVSIDACLVTPQNPIARFLIRHDRGRNVRSPAEYERLARRWFPEVKGRVRHRSWVPYTHWIMECGMPRSGPGAGQAAGG